MRSTPCVLLFAVVACSGKTAVTGGIVDGAAGGGGAGGSGGAGGGGVAGASCPSAPPTNGGTCTPPWTSSSFGSPTAHCSWGDDPRPDCRTTALCQTNGTWSVTAPGASCTTTPPLPPACPSPPPAATSTCSDSTLACWYPDGTRCWCSDCTGGSSYPICQPISPPEWACKTPGAGCPTKLPQAGSPCSAPGTQCGPDCNLEIVCEGGVWQWRLGNCPICAAPDTPIATPSGERPIASLRVGDLVYSVDDRAIVAVPIVRAGHTPVGAHRVMRVELEDGRVLEVSPGHPTADGRTFGELLPGSLLDAQHPVVSAHLVPYEHDATYDILPGSSTGTYFAAGALVGSTLRNAAMTQVARQPR